MTLAQHTEMSEKIRAVVITPEEEESARIEEIEVPEPEYDQCLMKVLEVGIDGTDREINAGEYGEAPRGDDFLVVGHECVGRVERAPDDGRGIREGDIVVPTVRRPCPEGCVNCRNGEIDFCLTGNFTERGIKGRHGFMREAYVEHPEFLVKVPGDLEDVAVWLEPISIIEKTFRQIDSIQSRVYWEPERMLVTGAGNMGILSALEGRLRGLDVLVYSRGPNEGVRKKIFDDACIRYQDSEEKEMDEIMEDFGPADIFVEGTGFSPLVWEGLSHLEVNGIGCLLSVTNGNETVELPSDDLNNHMVMGNRVAVGVVNASRRDFENGIESLLEIRERWPGTLERFITSRVSLDDAAEALKEKGHDDLKTVVEVG